MTLFPFPVMQYSKWIPRQVELFENLCRIWFSVHLDAHWGCLQLKLINELLIGENSHIKQFSVFNVSRLFVKSKVISESKIVFFNFFTGCRWDCEDKEEKLSLKIVRGKTNSEQRKLWIAKGTLFLNKNRFYPSLTALRWLWILYLVWLPQDDCKSLISLTALNW